MSIMLQVANSEKGVAPMTIGIGRTQYFALACFVILNTPAVGDSLPDVVIDKPPPITWTATPSELEVEQRRGQSSAEAWTSYLLGRGYNGLSGELRADCLSGKLTSSSGGKKVDYTIHLAGSSEEFRRSVNMNAGASFGLGAWSTDASVAYFQSTERSRYVDHMVVRVLVSGPIVSYANPKLTQEANRLKNIPINFYRKCGNRYVKSLAIGGEFVAVVNIETSSQVEREALRASLTVVAKGYGSASAEYKQAMERISKSYQKDIRIIRNGLNERVPKLDLETLVAYSLEFPEKINNSNGVPVGLEYSDYRTVDPDIDVYSSQEIVVTRMSDKFGELYTMLGDLEYYSRHKASGMFFPPMSDETLRRHREVVGDATLKSKLAFNACAEDPGTKCRLELFPDLEVAVPRPAQKVELDPRVGSSQWIGSAGSGEKKTIVILGDWSAWSSGENLWWPPERCCFTIEVARETGPKELHAYSGPQQFVGPARFSIRIGDSTYEDNRGRGLMGIVY